MSSKVETIGKLGDEAIEEIKAISLGGESRLDKGDASILFEKNAVYFQRY